MTLTGVVQNFAGLMVVRVLLGIFEAGFFPGAIYCEYSLGLGLNSDSVM